MTLFEKVKQNSIFVIQLEIFFFYFIICLPVKNKQETRDKNVNIISLEKLYKNKCNFCVHLKLRIMSINIM